MFNDWTIEQSADVDLNSQFLSIGLNCMNDAVVNMIDSSYDVLTLLVVDSFFANRLTCVSDAAAKVHFSNIQSSAFRCPSVNDA